MVTPSRSRLRLFGLVAVLSLTMSVTACSDDSDEPAAEDDTESTSADAWCDAVRAGQRAPGSQRLASLQSQAEVAPPELKDAYEQAIEMVTHASENPDDIVGIAERQQAAVGWFSEIAGAAIEKCDITIDLAA